MDAVVDHYFGVIDGVDRQLTEIDDVLQENAAAVEANVLFSAKRDVAELHRLVRPIREIAAALHHGDSALITDFARPFFRDLHDHAVQAVESVEYLRDLAAGLRDFYLSAVSHRMNEIMKVLTLFSSFFLPLTFLAGVYGMNFKHMPELDVPWAYPALWGVFGALALGMFVWFRRRKWF
jgi:magnesium transporter